MSLIASYYDNISKNYYHTADIFGVLFQSCHTAADQVLKSDLLSHLHHFKNLDWGLVMALFKNSCITKYQMQS